jgi:hypothetical protein
MRTRLERCPLKWHIASIVYAVNAAEAIPDKNFVEVQGMVEKPDTFKTKITQKLYFYFMFLTK